MRPHRGRDVGWGGVQRWHRGTANRKTKGADLLSRERGLSSSFCASAFCASARKFFSDPRLRHDFIPVEAPKDAGSPEPGTGMRESRRLLTEPAAAETGKGGRRGFARSMS